ncbi:hypothetical protein ACQP1G_21865 [Nocardia sp. CA-107356]|uniref:hypothetical protein n=1 Tax=Nocardia sp. CA-107356 TaxID=3239972 RepID=UPI003D9016D3
MNCRTDRKRSGHQQLSCDSAQSADRVNATEARVPTVAPMPMKLVERLQDAYAISNCGTNLAV